METFKSQVPVIENGTILNLTLANTRARLRMTTLYYLGGLYMDLLSLERGNKVEDFGDLDFL